MPMTSKEVSDKVFPATGAEVWVVTQQQLAPPQATSPRAGWSWQSPPEPPQGCRVKNTVTVAPAWPDDEGLGDRVVMMLKGKSDLCYASRADA